MERIQNAGRDQRLVRAAAVAASGVEMVATATMDTDKTTTKAQEHCGVCPNSIAKRSAMGRRA